MKHIKTPCSLDVYGEIYDADDGWVAEYSWRDGEPPTDENKEYGTEILRALNAHDALVAACKAAKRLLEPMIVRIDGVPRGSFSEEYVQLIDAIALAGETT